MYELVDGSVWVQAAYRYHYQYMYRPKARIIVDASRRFLEVDGMKERIEVRSGTKADLDRS